MLRTGLCERLGIEAPVFCAPMGFVTGPELAAAVSEAGGLGIMSFGPNPPELLRRDIARLRSLTGKPFGVNVLVEPIELGGLPFTTEDIVGVCIAERVPVLSFAWADPAPYIERAHAAGMTVIHQISTVAEARRSVELGVDVVIAQGAEAGGHVNGVVALSILVPRIVDAVAPAPVVAAGGIADGRGLVAALALGAEAVVMGTRFIATPEALAHPVYKEKLVAATETETERTMLFGFDWPNAPHRVLRTPIVEAWKGREHEGQGPRADAPVIGEIQVGGQPMPMRRFMSFPPNITAKGDIEAMALYAGQSVGLVHDIKPAGEIVREVIAEARDLIERLHTGAPVAAHA